MGGLFAEGYVKSYGSGYAYSGVNYRVKLARIWSIYFWKIFFFRFIITLSSFSVYSLDDDKAANKYALLLTLLLTNVAFQFVINTFIPRLPYLTILDYYAIGSVLVTFLVMAQIFVYELMDIEQDDEGGSSAGILIGGLFGIKQIIFIVWGWKARKYETKKLQMDGFDYKNN